MQHHLLRTFLAMAFVTALCFSVPAAAQNPTGATSPNSFNGVSGNAGPSPAQGTAAPQSRNVSAPAAGGPGPIASGPATPVSVAPFAPAAPVTPTAPAAPVAPVAPVPAATAPAQAPATTDTQKIDPCAAYMYSYDVYTVCQDRMQKIQRMQDAKLKRNPLPPAPAPAVAPAPAPPTPAPAAAPAAGTAPAAGSTAPQPAPANHGISVAPVVSPSKRY